MASVANRPVKSIDISGFCIGYILAVFNGLLKGK